MTYYDPDDTETEDTTDTLAGFLATYHIDPLVNVDAPRLTNDSEPCWIELRSPYGTLLLDVRTLVDPTDDTKSHLCVDVHAFDAAGTKARTGVFGMDAGYRSRLADEQGNSNTGGTSHGWPAASTVVLMLGTQKETTR